MNRLKNILLAVFVGIAPFASAPSVFAAGKIENATVEEVTQAIDDTINYSEEALAAMKNGADKDTVLALIKKTKQSSKRIESNVVDRLRSQANSRMSKARTDYKKGNNEEAIAKQTEAVELYKEVKTKYHSF